MPRSILLALIREAGYHGDTKRGTRLYCENRVSMPAYQKAYQEGVRMKENGVACTCTECR